MQPLHARSPSFCPPTKGGALTAAFKGLKQRFTFLLPRFGLLEALEAAKVWGLVHLVTLLHPCMTNGHHSYGITQSCDRWRTW